MNRILLMRTGGTMDAEAYADPRHPPEMVSTLKGNDNAVTPILAEIPYQDYVDVHKWGAQEECFVKDSKLFDGNDIRRLAKIISNDPHRFFLIPHGTDHMCLNAATLKKELAGTDKVVAFLGAMVPHTMDYSHGSDGPAALTFAIERMTRHFDPRTNDDPLCAGVYTVSRDAKTGRLGFFDPAKVSKDLETSRKNLAFTVRARA